MLRDLVISGSVLVALNAAVYQLWLKEILEVTVGVGRIIQNIEEFPYDCQRLEHHRLEACEDLWLDDEARVLYAACAGSQSRVAWNQATDRFNQSGRRPGGGELIALDIDTPGSDGLFNLRAIKPVDYIGAAGDTSFDPIGFDAEIIDAATIHFHIVNERPPVDYQLNYISAASMGANSTIDTFEHKRGATEMKHLRTIFSPEVYAPNNIAAVGGSAVVIANDHSGRVGFRKKLDPILGGGNLAYCSSTSSCHRASPLNLKFPNGLVRGADGLIYVPSTIDGKVRVFRLNSANELLQHIDTIELRMPLDNLAVDANGDLWVPGAPDFWSLMRWVEHPLVEPAKVAVLRVKKVGGWKNSGKGNTEYVVEKMLEDGEVKVLSGITTVRHDVKTGRLFMGGAFNPYLVVCEPR
ncbi:calcium-dependent phosphotriesterase [Lentithecium fluviatile CBS 122367]|uniref:Calcium-dependent phosphotriesterase n=1 Tax=Lentithecium fluviatile CBS 122367 TaxID=1168545 RepID=A0A6G1IF93_9PLEO|nr:calcium-dependent phosphotriesterase [Lentithecium fluviatile CBS 122367]